MKETYYTVKRDLLYCQTRPTCVYLRVLACTCVYFGMRARLCWCVHACINMSHETFLAACLGHLETHLGAIDTTHTYSAHTSTHTHTHARAHTQGAAYGPVTIAFGGECAGPVPSPLRPLQLVLDDAASRHGLALSVRSATPGGALSADLHQTILHVDRALPDGSILFHHAAPSAHASHTGEVLLQRLWGDAKERSCVSSLSWRQQPLALGGGGGRAGRPGAAVVPMVEHGGDVLATDASGHLFLLSHQPPPRVEDLAPGVVMAGQVATPLAYTKTPFWPLLRIFEPDISSTPACVVFQFSYPKQGKKDSV